MSGTCNVVWKRGVHAKTPNNRAIILETNPPEARGMALALQTVLDDLGRGLGPFVIGLLVQVTSRLVAFNIAILGWIPCGMLIYGMLNVYHI